MRGRFRFLGAMENGFLRLLRVDVRREQDWKSYAKTVLIFSAVFSVPLYVLMRLQGHLPLNPDHLPGVSAHIALNTTASFITNTNWQYYGGEYTMSYLSQMAGLAVQNWVSAAVGMAVLAAVVRGFSHRSTSEPRQLLARPLPRDRLHPVPAGARARRRPDLAGRRPDLRRARDRDHAPGRAPDDRARPGRLADRDQAARHERRRLLQLELRRPLREPDRALELPRGARDPADPGGAGGHVREDGRRPAPGLRAARGDVRDVRDRRRDRAPGRAARLRGAAQLRREHHAGQRPERRQHVGQGNPIRDRQLRPLVGADDRRLERLGEQRPRRVHARRRRRPPRQHLRRRGDLRRRRLGPLRDVLLRRDRGVRGRADDRPHPGVPRQEDRGARDQVRRRRRALRADDGADHGRRLGGDARSGSPRSSIPARTASPRPSTPTPRSRTTTAAPSPATARPTSPPSSARSASTSAAGCR